MLAPAAPTWQRLLLRLLAATPLGRAPLVPSAATANWGQYEDPDLLEEVERDPRRCLGRRLRVASAASAVELGHRTRASLGRVVSST